MPVPYNIPPWIQGTNWLSAFSQAASLNQRERQLQVENQLAQQRLEQAMQIAQMNLAAAAQHQQENLQRRDAEIAYKSAYDDALVGLRERDLQEKTKLAENKINEAASRAAAQMSFSRLVSKGMDPAQAAMQSGLAGSMTPDAVARMGTIPNQAMVPEAMNLALPSGGSVDMIRRGRQSWSPAPRVADWTRKFQATQMAKELNQKQALLNSPIATPGQKAGIPERIKELQSGISNILQGARVPQVQSQDDNERESGKVDEGAMTPDDEDIQNFLDELDQQDTQASDQPE